MIVAVTTLFHDYEPRLAYVDTEALDPNDYIDGIFLQSLQEGKDWISLDASNWEEEPDKFPRGDDVDLSGGYLVERPDKFDRAIIFRISFE